MRGKIVSIALAVCFMMGGTAMARQLDGFAGTAFGTPLTALPSFLTIKTDGDVAYAVNLSESYRLNGRAPVVFYGFAGGKLFAAYIRLDGMITRDAMAKQLSAQFGKPSIVREEGVEIMRWRKGKVKVKLKSDAATGSLKLGYYAAAKPGLPSKLLDLDNVDIEGLNKLYDKEKISKDIKLPPASSKERSPFEGDTSKTARPQ